MPYINTFSRLRPLFALAVVLAPFTYGLAVPQEDVGTVAVAGEEAEADTTSTSSTVQAATIAASLPDSTAPLQIAPFPARPMFDNSTRFQDPKNYTDVDAPIVTSDKNSSNLTTYHVQDKEIFGDLPITNIPVYFTATPANLTGPNPISMGNATSEAIDFAMPQILSQLEVPQQNITPLVEDTSPILTEALMYLLGQTDIPEQLANDTETDENLTKRGWSCCKGISIKKVGQAVGDVITFVPKAIVKGTEIAGCSFTASNLLSGYLATYAQVKGQNPGPGIPPSESHMFFLYQLYGNFPLTANLRLHFNTRKFLGVIGEYDAITFARDIFIVGDGRLSPRPGRADFFFQKTVTTIIHEIRHSQQYRSMGWSVPAFGAKYLYQYCAAGFKYKTLVFEKEAYTQENAMNGLLYNDDGYKFFRYWRFRKLGPVLGYPVATTFRKQPGDEIGLYEVPFQYGVLLATFYEDGDACWRYLTTAEAEAREKVASCTAFSGRCEPFTTTYEKAMRRREECLKDENLK